MLEENSLGCRREPGGEGEREASVLSPASAPRCAVLQDIVGAFKPQVPVGFWMAGTAAVSEYAALTGCSVNQKLSAFGVGAWEPCRPKALETLVGERAGRHLPPLC